MEKQQNNYDLLALMDNFTEGEKKLIYWAQEELTGIRPEDECGHIQLLEYTLATIIKKQITAFMCERGYCLYDVVNILLADDYED